MWSAEEEDGGPCQKKSESRPSGSRTIANISGLLKSTTGDLEALSALKENVLEISTS